MPEEKKTRREKREKRSGEVVQKEYEAACKALGEAGVKRKMAMVTTDNSLDTLRATVDSLYAELALTENGV